jgi:hypothetical protein
MWSYLSKSEVNISFGRGGGTQIIDLGLFVGVKLYFQGPVNRYGFYIARRRQPSIALFNEFRWKINLALGQSRDCWLGSSDANSTLFVDKSLECTRVCHINDPTSRFERSLPLTTICNHSRIWRFKRSVKLLFDMKSELLMGEFVIWRIHSSMKIFIF